jgi:uncharacterized protein (UPF0276 family)
MSKFGVGLRHQHFPYLTQKPQTSVDWFEVITENFINTKGRPFEVLCSLREDYPVSLHGVSMSIGTSKQSVSKGYLKKLKELINIIDPILVSDHLCWTGNNKNNLHNLLPLSYNDQTINELVPKIAEVQDFLGREIALENLSAYFSLQNSTYEEWDFLRVLSEKAGSKILLDINNIYVNSQNQNFDPYKYLDAIPDHLVSEIHLAGFTDMGDFLFDTHSAPVFDDVWSLYKHKIKTCKNVPTLIEWDEDIPEFPILENEMLKAKNLWSENHG